MQVTVKEMHLEDGSKVYDINLPGDVTFQAVSFRDAREFCDKLVAAVTAHTNNDVDIYWL